MERFSVKKPFTILVAVIMVLALGYVSLTNLSTDLLPAISLPYMMVITPYPGASPEKVEASVTLPLENRSEEHTSESSHRIASRMPSSA